MRSFFKMDSTIFKIHQKLDSVIKYLTPLLPLANCHMVEFITHNHWHKLLPRPLTESLECLELNDAVELFWKSVKDVKNGSGVTELDKWVKNAQLHCVRANNDFCLTRDQLQSCIKAWGGEIKPEVHVAEFMNSKKSYEVQTMCGLLSSLHDVCASSCCVEVGGGRGPLLTALSLSYGVPSLTIDCDTSNVAAAERRAGIMKKQWHAIAKRVDGGVNESPNKESNLHRFASAFVTTQTDLAAVVRECFPEHASGDVRLLLTGLHTCGNLGPDSLRIFTSQPSTSAVFNVPCCYHLLTEVIDEGLYDVFQRDFGDSTVKEEGFPMAEYLKGTNLGRNARMLAAQSIDRVVGLKQLPGRSLLYRAMLQKIIRKHLPDATLADGRLKKLSSKIKNFEQYFKMADSILQLNLFDTVTDKYLLEINRDIDEHWKKLVLFYYLRLCLAQVIESVILLDRILYLKENGVANVYLVKLFDPVLSPRCHSIVAVR